MLKVLVTSDGQRHIGVHSAELASSNGWPYLDISAGAHGTRRDGHCAWVGAISSKRVSASNRVDGKCSILGICDPGRCSLEGGGFENDMKESGRMGGESRPGWGSQSPCHEMSEAQQQVVI